MTKSHTNSTVIRLILIIVAALVLFGLFSFYKRRKAESEQFSEPNSLTPLSARVSPAPAPAPVPTSAPVSAPAPAPQQSSHSSNLNASPVGIEPKDNEQFRPVAPNDGPAVFRDPFPQDRTSPEELLPRHAANTRWAQANPAGQGDLQNVNLLSAGYHIGVNTQGQSLRNASHDLRSEPKNPRLKVSIWSNSTIEEDMNRRPLE